MAVLNLQRSPRSLRIFALALFFICSSTYVLFHPSVFDFDVKARLHRVSLGGAGGGAHASSDNNIATPSSPPPPPNITIIAIWNPKTDAPPQPYLPNFFASVRANPKVHLLFVVFDKFNYGCDRRISPDEKNIQEICFDTESYWRLHRDFLCQYWGCTAQDGIPLLQTLIRRSNNDHVCSFFLNPRPSHSAPHPTFSSS